MKLSDTRTAKNIYDKGNSLKGISVPSSSNEKSTSRFDTYKEVRYNKELLKKQDKMKSADECLTFLKNFK